jgi:hypothetical protein
MDQVDTEDLYATILVLKPKRKVMSRKQIVSNKQLGGIDKFVGAVLDAYNSGSITRQDAILDIGHVIVAVDEGNETEIVQYPINRIASLEK